MTWQITIGGHHPTIEVGSEAQHEQEKELAEKAAEFVASIADEGVQTATFSGNMLHRNLRELVATD